MTLKDLENAVETLKASQNISLRSEYKVIESPLMKREYYEQFRFPKSKKKRIRKKWSKRKENWKWIEKELAMRIEGDLFVGPKTYQKLKNG